MLVLRWVTEVASVVEQEENNTEKNPAVIKKSIDEDFMFVSFLSPQQASSRSQSSAISRSSDLSIARNSGLTTALLGEEACD
jgi:hypothetical protein